MSAIQQYLDTLTLPEKNYIQQMALQAYALAMNPSRDVTAYQLVLEALRPAILAMGQDGFEVEKHRSGYVQHASMGRTAWSDR
jgi:hypothetical protein